MVILDAPYASDMLLDWLEVSQHPVLANDFTRSLAGRTLDLVDDAEAAALVDAGQRVYTNSENALAWLMDNTHAEGLHHGISVFKDKLACRRALAELDADLFFRECTADELARISFSDLPGAVVLKPSVGFCSLGVYVVRDAEEWAAALADIQRDHERWVRMYPDSVVDAGRFILEGYISGQEYAIDAFFDAEGAAQVLNVLKHDFASEDDTSDRMYTASAEIYEQMAPVFKEWLDKVSAVVGVHDFPVHVEVRVDEHGHISPIEFNPMRFAGLGGTDVAQYAFGFKTYQAYLEDELPSAEAYRSKAGRVFTMSLLNPPAGTDGTESFDYDAFTSRFKTVHEMRRFDADKVGNYGFLFIETDPDSPELAFLLHDDLRGFISGPAGAGGAAGEGDAQAQSAPAPAMAAAPDSSLEAALFDAVLHDSSVVTLPE